MVLSGCGENSVENEEKEKSSQDVSSEKESILIGELYGIEGKKICDYEENENHNEGFALAGKARAYTFSYQRGG